MCFDTHNGGSQVQAPRLQSFLSASQAPTEHIAFLPHLCLFYSSHKHTQLTASVFSALLHSASPLAQRHKALAENDQVKGLIASIIKSKLKTLACMAELSSNIIASELFRQISINSGEF